MSMLTKYESLKEKEKVFVCVRALRGGENKRREKREGQEEMR